MVEGSGNAKEISLGENLGPVVVSVNGARIEVDEDGRVTANDAQGIGDRMPDGTTFAGISPDTDKPMYATPADAPLTYTFREAARYAKQLNAQKYLGHDDWRVPTKNELDALFNDLAAIGGFDESGAGVGGWYWSSSQLSGEFAWAQRFSDGRQNYGYFKEYDSSLRCVRG